MSKTFATRDECLASNTRYTRRAEARYSMYQYYQFPINGIGEIVAELKAILQRYATQIRIQVSVGYMLVNVRDETYRFHFPSTNTSILPGLQPRFVKRKRD